MVFEVEVVHKVSLLSLSSIIITHKGSYRYYNMTTTKDISFEAFKPGASVIQVSGRNFTDNHGRVLDLRGANVGSSSKVYVALKPTLSITNTQTREAAIQN